MSISIPVPVVFGEVITLVTFPLLLAAIIWFVGPNEWGQAFQIFIKESAQMHWHPFYWIASLFLGYMGVLVFALFAQRNMGDGWLLGGLWIIPYSFGTCLAAVAILVFFVGSSIPQWVAAGFFRGGLGPVRPTKVWGGGVCGLGGIVFFFLFCETVCN
jgi:hypothetical protein